MKIFCSALSKLAVPVICFLLSGTTLFAANWNPLPDTGQTQCYDVSGNVITCPAEGEALYGQDAHYQSAIPSYTDNGDGTVTDNNTGLRWQQTDDSVRRTWQEAVDYCETLTINNQGNWRLPDVMELESILDYAHTLSINPIFLETDGNYWTKTITAESENYAWGIDFTGAGSGRWPKVLTAFARCVQGALTPKPIYTSPSSGIISDQNTGLVWEQKTADIDNDGFITIGDKTTWENALEWCENLTLSGYSDWRLPNSRELRSLVDRTTDPPAIDSIFQCESDNYWSATTSESIWTNWIFNVLFSNGSSSTQPRCDNAYIRCVRGGLPSDISGAVSVTAPVGGDTYHHRDEVTIQWTDEGAQPTDEMIISMKRDTVSTLTSPDDKNWYRFPDYYLNDGSATITLPDTLLSTDDWRFFVQHRASGNYGASEPVSITEALDRKPLYVFKPGDGSGTVTSNPANINCLDGCSGQLARFNIGETVTLTAEAANCSTFQGWEGCDQVNGNECVVTIKDDDITIVQADFTADENAVLLEIVFPNQPFEQGSVSSTPNALNCQDGNGACNVSYCPGDAITLSATPADGITFNGWMPPQNADPCDSVSGNNCTIILPSEKTLQVMPQFSDNPPYNLHIDTAGNGKGLVTDNEYDIECGSEISPIGCDKKFSSDEVIVLHAEPDAESSFSHWEGWHNNECYGSRIPSCTVTMSSAHIVSAVFTGRDMGVTVTANKDVLSYNKLISYDITVSNHTDSDAIFQARVTISGSSLGPNGEEANWHCADIESDECRKSDTQNFDIFLVGGESTVITGVRLYDENAQINTGSVTAALSFSGDVESKNNTATHNLYRDPHLLEKLSTELVRCINGFPYAEGRENSNTVVLTHGWMMNDPERAESDPLCAGRFRLACLGNSQQLWTSPQPGGAADLILRNIDSAAASSVPNQISNEINMMQYIWDGAYTQSRMDPEGYIRARRNVFDAGTKLGKELIDLLQEDYDTGESTYSGKIHFIGHSLGTAVNAYAIRYFLDHNSSATIQMTVLDHPNRVRRIGIMDTLGDNGETRWGFDENFFANVLPEINDDNFGRLIVDNYFAAEPPDPVPGHPDYNPPENWRSAGVGTAISGEKVYNHEFPVGGTAAQAGTGLVDPNDVGQELFTDEGLAGNYNDHSGVHQWYRWTMWPSLGDRLQDENFVCNNDREWVSLEDTPEVLSAESLRPCGTGFAHSILLDEDAREAEFPTSGKLNTSSSPAAGYDLVGGTNAQRCSITEESPVKIVCSNLILQENVAHLQTAAEESTPHIVTDSAYAITHINLKQAASTISFDYKFDGSAEDEDVFLLIDGQVAWSLSSDSAVQGVWQKSGKIPARIEKGSHEIMIAFNNTTTTSSFELQSLEFFQAPDDNKFPWTMFLPAIIGSPSTDTPCSLTNNNNGTVSGTCTNLMWQQSYDGSGKTWAEAKTYCDQLQTAGFNDWRLPTKDELKGLVVCTNGAPTPLPDSPASPGNCGDGYSGEYVSPTIDPVFECDTVAYYWTSTLRSSTTAWINHFANGTNGWNGLNVPYNVRCVRNQ